MSESITVARPYAKALFDLAKYNKNFDDWDKLLSFLSTLTSDSFVSNFIKNRTISHSDKAQLIISFIESRKIFSFEIQDLIINFIKIISYNNRFLCLKDIRKIYNEYVNLELGRLEAVIKVAFPISSSQKTQIIDSLSKRFNKKVSAIFEVDKNLLGGFCVQIGDYILDASVAGNLISLRTKIMI